MGLTRRSIDKRKLSDIDVLMIRRHTKLNDSEMGSLAVSRMFGVSRTTIERIVKGETYQHLPPSVGLRTVRRYKAIPAFVRSMHDESDGLRIEAAMAYVPRPLSSDYAPCSLFVMVHERRQFWCDVPGVEWQVPSRDSFIDVYVYVAPDGTVVHETTLEAYAAMYREARGIESTKVRKPRRSKRQMEWHRKFALKPGEVGPKEAARRERISETLSTRYALRKAERIAQEEGPEAAARYRANHARYRARRKGELHDYPRPLHPSPLHPSPLREALPDDDDEWLEEAQERADAMGAMGR